MAADEFKTRVYGINAVIPELEQMEAELRGARCIIAVLARRTEGGLRVNDAELEGLDPNGEITVSYDILTGDVVYTYRVGGVNG